MNHPLTLQIPEALWRWLNSQATQTGQTSENVALQWLSEAAQQATDDPVEQLIGTVPSNSANWTASPNEVTDIYL